MMDGPHQQAACDVVSMCGVLLQVQTEGIAERTGRVDRKARADSHRSDTFLPFFYSYMFTDLLFSFSSDWPFQTPFKLSLA